jgi:hypothetical protein
MVGIFLDMSHKPSFFLFIYNIYFQNFLPSKLFVCLCLTTAISRAILGVGCRAWFAILFHFLTVLPMFEESQIGVPINEPLYPVDIGLLSSAAVMT